MRNYAYLLRRRYGIEMYSTEKNELQWKKILFSCANPINMSNNTQDGFSLKNIWEKTRVFAGEIKVSIKNVLFLSGIDIWLKLCSV